MEALPWENPLGLYGSWRLWALPALVSPDSPPGWPSLPDSLCLRPAWSSASGQTGQRTWDDSDSPGKGSSLFAVSVHLGLGASTSVLKLKKWDLNLAGYPGCGSPSSTLPVSHRGQLALVITTLPGGRVTEWKACPSSGGFSCFCHFRGRGRS